MMKFRERWLEDHSKARFLNCGFIHNPVKMNYESQREMGQKVRLEFAGRGGRRAGTTAGALLTHRVGQGTAKNTPGGLWDTQKELLGWKG